MHVRIALAGVLAFALTLGLAAAVPLGPAPGPGTATEAPRYTARPAAREAPPAERAARGTRLPPRLPLLRLPIAGQAIPEEAELLPEAARDYRAGIHEGIDFPVDAGTPVVAAANGTVLRSDREFTDWTAEERAAAFAQAIELGRTPEPTLDRIRGRQVWIDHGSGIVTRYVHLESVAVSAGDRVSSGSVVGTVGSSGYPEGGPHLHFEVRIGDSYLGDGLTPAELARALRQAFR